MAPRLRRMKSYRPRKRRKKAELTEVKKQTLYDLKHKISSRVGSLIVMIREGSLSEIPRAHLDAKSSFLKYSREMEKVASQVGEKVTSAVKEYLQSVDTLIHTRTEWVDEDKIQKCYTADEKLEQELKKVA